MRKQEENRANRPEKPERPERQEWTLEVETEWKKSGNPCNGGMCPSSVSMCEEGRSES